MAELKITVRIDDDTYKALQVAAVETGRSVNSEIVHRLESSFRGSDFGAVVAALTISADRVTRLETALQDGFQRLADLHATQGAVTQQQMAELARLVAPAPKPKPAVLFRKDGEPFPTPKRKKP